MSVKRCQQEVDRPEFLEWVWHYEQSPWDRQAEQMATIMTLLANLLRVDARILQANGGRLPTWTKPDDFLPRAHPQPPQTPEQAKALVGMFFRQAGAFT